MALTGPDLASRLACCHGYLVASGDDFVGIVETPVFSGDALAPDALIVRSLGATPVTYRRVASGLVAHLDEAARRITLRDDPEQAT